MLQLRELHMGMSISQKSHSFFCLEIHNMPAIIIEFNCTKHFYLLWGIPLNYFQRLFEKLLHPHTTLEVPLQMSETLVGRTNVAWCTAIFHLFAEYAVPCSSSFQHLHETRSKKFNFSHSTMSTVARDNKLLGKCRILKSPLFPKFFVFHHKKKI